MIDRDREIAVPEEYERMLIEAGEIVLRMVDQVGGWKDAGFFSRLSALLSRDPKFTQNPKFIRSALRFAEIACLFAENSPLKDTYAAQWADLVKQYSLIDRRGALKWTSNVIAGFISDNHVGGFDSTIQKHAALLLPALIDRNSAQEIKTALAIMETARNEAPSSNGYRETANEVLLSLGRLRGDTNCAEADATGSKPLRTAIILAFRRPPLTGKPSHS